LEEKDGKAIQVPTVTVSITPEEAEKLALASNVGTLQLLLRGAKDNAPTSTRGASTANLLGGSGQPVVARVARRTSVVAAPVRENEEVNITIIKSDKGGTTRSQERLIEDGGFWKRSEVSK
jgi:pilus assembly protein CpaB